MKNRLTKILAIIMVISILAASSLVSVYATEEVVEESSLAMESSSEESGFSIDGELSESSQESSTVSSTDDGSTENEQAPDEESSEPIENEEKSVESEGEEPSENSVGAEASENQGSTAESSLSEPEFAQIPESTPAPNGLRGGLRAGTTDKFSILKNVAASVSVDGKIISETTKINSKKPINVKIEFVAPLLGSGEDEYIKKGDTATMVIAKGLKLTSSVGPLLFEQIIGGKKVKIGEVTLSTNVGGDVIASIVFNGDDFVFDDVGGQYDWAEANCDFSVELLYDATSDGGAEGERDVTIFNKTYTVVVLPPPTEVTMEKTGSRDGKFVDWKIKVRSEKAGADGDLSNHVFVDDISTAGTYTENTFKVGAEDDISKATQANLDADAPAAKLKYTFPAGTQGTRYIFFKTEIADDPFYTNNEVTIVNKAQVLKDTVEVAKDEASIKFQQKWIEKSNGTQDNTTGEISWIITVNQGNLSLNGATITDVLQSNLLFEKATILTWNAATNSFEDGKTFTSEPVGGVYELGDINTVTALKIEAKLNLTGDELSHQIVTVENSATLSWIGGKNIGSNKVENHIGHNPIDKNKTAYDVSTHQASWTVKAGKSYHTKDLRVVDLLVYGTSFDMAGTYTFDSNDPSKLTGITPAAFAKLEPNYNQSYVSGSWEALGASNLELTVHTVKKDGKAVADLMVVTGALGSEINVDTDQSFKFNTVVTNPDIYISNKESNKISNNAILLSKDVEVNKDKDTIEFRSDLLKKDTLKGIENTEDLKIADNVNKADGVSDNSFNYVDKSAVFRLHVNASGIVDVTGGLTTDSAQRLGAATVTDVLPAGWEFVDVVKGEKFLIYEGEANTSGANIKAKTLIENASFLAADFETKGTAKFTFTTLDKPYLILVRAKPTDSVLSGYFSINASTEVENRASIVVENSSNTISSSAKVLVKSQTLSKSSKVLPEGGVINWTVDYNPYGMSYPDTVIEDTLPNGLDLRTDSFGRLNTSGGFITITELIFDKAGTPAIKGEPLENIGEYISFNNNSRILKFAVPNANKGYRLTYLTDITGDVAQTLTNSVKISNGHAGDSAFGVPYVVTANDVSAVMSRSGWVQIEKTNIDGRPLEGVGFTIFAADNETPLKYKETPSDGILIIRGLDVGNYILRETKAPEGYSVSNAIHKVEVVKNAETITTLIDGKTGADSGKIKIVNNKVGVVGSVEVSKTLSGNDTEADRLFEFTITVDGLNGKYPFVTNEPNNGELEFSNGVAKFELKGGDKLEILDLPKDKNYTVEEKSYETEGYATENTNAKGTIEADVIKKVEFINTKNKPLPAKVSFKVEKTLNGKAPSGADYSFVLKDANGKTLQTKFNNGGLIEFDEIVFSEEGEFNYTIEEIKGTDLNVSYDTSVYTAVVKVAKNTDWVADASYFMDGKSYSGVPVFKNTTSTTPPSEKPTPKASEMPSEAPVASIKPSQIPPEGGNNTGASPAPSKTPTTGGESAVALWLTTMLISAGFVSLLILRKKYKG